MSTTRSKASGGPQTPTPHPGTQPGTQRPERHEPNPDAMPQPGRPAPEITNPPLPGHEPGEGPGIIQPGTPVIETRSSEPGRRASVIPCTVW